MRRIILIFFFFTPVLMIIARDFVTTSIEYVFYAPETMTVEEAKHVALYRAKIQAISDQYGTRVSQTVSSVVSTSNGQSDSHFFSIGGSDVKGEWIETIGDPVYDITYQDKMLVVRCIVKGVIAPNKNIALDFVANTLCNVPELRFEQTDFEDGDDMFLFFRSPYSGYLSAFWIDWKEKKVYMILPYNNAETSLVKVKKNTDYYFFSKEKDSSSARSVVDEYNLTCSEGTEYNELCLCFSDQPFVIPLTHTDFRGIRILSLKDFEEWKSKLNRSKDNILFKTYQITITSKNNLRL